MSRLRPITGWVRWLYPGIHVKRWLILLMLSMLLVALGFAYFLRNLYSDVSLPGSIHNPGSPAGLVWYLTLQFLSRGTRAAIFGMSGVGLLVFSFVMLGRSVLGPFVPGGDRSLAEALYHHRYLQRGARVVAIGGGTGLSSLLRGLKKYTANLTAIVTVADDGGSSGKLRQEYRVLPPGDMRQCLTALADSEPLMTQLFQHRFTDGSLNGHSFGNLFILAMSEVTGDIEHALRESGKILAVRGQVVPSALHDVTLCAEMKDGVIAVGESHIPEVRNPIRKVFLTPERTEINPEAEQAILNSELVIVGPGSLYTSIMPNLLVDGMVEAIKASPAIKVFVCNVATQRGETEGFSVSDHLDVIEDHVGENLFDFVVVNSNHVAMPDRHERVLFDQDRARRHPVRFLLAGVVDRRRPTHHDPERLAKVLMKQIWRA
ncbi:MAG: gluconeogenesis factor YvcK family protein [Candidatus Dormibacteria bacterium]